MNMRRSILRIALVPGIVGASLVGGFAFASFTMHAEPWADGHIGAVKNPTASAQVVGDMWPGICNDIAVTLTNDNPRPVALDDTKMVDVQAPEGTGQFLTYNAPIDALQDTVLAVGQTRSFTIKDGICLSANADDQPQGDDIRVGLFIAAHIVPGNEAAAS